MFPQPATVFLIYNAIDDLIMINDLIMIKSNDFGAEMEFDLSDVIRFGHDRLVQVGMGRSRIRRCN